MKLQCGEDCCRRYEVLKNDVLSAAAPLRSRKNRDARGCVVTRDEIEAALKVFGCQENSINGKLMKAAMEAAERARDGARSVVRGDGAMTLGEMIKFWEDRARESNSDAWLIAAGVAAGLRMARDDYGLDQSVEARRDGSVSLRSENDDAAEDRARRSNAQVRVEETKSADSG
jgi:hypothetical protein